MTNITTEREAFQSLSPQAMRLVTHLRKKGSISNVEAQAVYKMRALPRRIADLREAGYQITKVTERDTTGQRYARYSAATPFWKQPEPFVPPVVEAEREELGYRNVGSFATERFPGSEPVYIGYGYEKGSQWTTPPQIDKRRAAYLVDNWKNYEVKTFFASRHDPRVSRTHLSF